MFKHIFKPKTKEPLPDFSHIKVTLKPMFGIRPGIYLTILYAIILFALIFVIFFLPGLINNGTWITFKSWPLQSAVFINGQRVGVTPCELLVKRGSHIITFSRPGYKKQEIKKEVGSYIFAFPFFPLRDEISIKLEVENITELVNKAYEEFSAWARIEEFSKTYRCPPVLTEACKSIYAKPDEETYRQLNSLLEASLAQIHEPYQALDLWQALQILETKGQSYSLTSQLKAYQRAKNFLELNPQAAFWLYLILPTKRKIEVQSITNLPCTKEDLEKSAWFKSKVQKYQISLTYFKVERQTPKNSPFTLAEVKFVPIPAGSYIMGKANNIDDLLNSTTLRYFPRPVQIREFYLAQTEITNHQFSLFLQDNPEWRPSNKNKLIKQDLVDEYYLKHWQGDSYAQAQAKLPVIYVSSYAAEAYCRWLSLKLVNTLAGYKARLPLESEWEWAAAGGDPVFFKTPGSVFKSNSINSPLAAGSSRPNLFGLQDMAGNVWEWCADWFNWAGNILPLNEGQLNIFKRASVRSVRGGSYANEADKIEVYLRGGAKSSACLPYYGFRPALVAK